MTILQQVQEFATRAHGTQRRKFEDAPYYVHLVRVMELCETVTKDMPILAAALLHDTLEDTPVTSRELNEFLQSVMSDSDAKRTHQLVTELTDVYIKARYPQWNRSRRKQQEVIRLSGVSAEAQTIKYADIIDNSRSFAGNDDEFAGVYLKEAKTLLNAMTKGNVALKEKAMETVNGLLNKKPL
jgi:guanosine-3',5'-bis(diphosphate) 3'-pyrophosphohydrolase